LRAFSSSKHRERTAGNHEQRNDHDCGEYRMKSVQAGCQSLRHMVCPSIAGDWVTPSFILCFSYIYLVVVMGLCGQLHQLKNAYTFQKLA